MFGTQSSRKNPNRYPVWRYVVSLVAVLIAVIFALPNLYPPDPAIQVQTDNAKTNGKPFNIGPNFLEQVADYLTDNGIELIGQELLDNGAQFRVTTDADQLRAKTLLEDRLNPFGKDRQFVVALNRAKTTPAWLQKIGGRPMTLGLDLAGGIHFVLQVDMTAAVRDQLESAAEEIQSTLRSSENRIRYLPGTDVVEDRTLTLQFPDLVTRDAAFEVLSNTYGPPNFQLDYYTVGEQPAIQLTITSSYIEELEDVAIEQNLTGLRSRVNELNVSEPLVQRLGQSRIVVELPGVQDSGEAKRILDKFATLEFRLVAKPDDKESDIETFPYEDRQVKLQKKIIVTGENVVNAQPGVDPETSLPQVSITLNSEGGQQLHRITKDNVNEPMGILFIEQKPVVISQVIDGERVETTRIESERRLISVSNIAEPLGYRSRITGISSQEARELSILLRAGALAAPMYFVEERTVGASLGAENINRGVAAVTIGFVLVLLFMLVYYKVFGFIANIALTLNLIVLIAIMSMLGATLTLPGIAGIVLTVGMAVDANVLIFSRIREELKHSTPAVAIPAGYDRAFRTILDANITTLFVALILLTIGSGPIAGFAITLSIGILTSMFTAIFVSRGVVHLVYGRRKVERLWI
ncbi:MAG: protein translocase subunit SecD [Gammaproteobacteria bacterium]|nr:protein translocase subunit SecD [Gammaproteobacteria bacterium]